MAISNLQQQALRTGANGYYINDDLIFSFEETDTNITEKEVIVNILKVVNRTTGGGTSYNGEISTVIKLYKNTEGKFSYNYKGVVKKLVQTIGYDDGTTDSNLFNNLYLQILDNSTFTQITNNIRRIIIADLQVNESPLTRMDILHEEYKTIPFLFGNRIFNPKIQMWRGYPFDITIYEDSIDNDLTIIRGVVFPDLGGIGKTNLKLLTTRNHFTTKINYDEVISENSTRDIRFLSINIGGIPTKNYNDFVQVHPECSDEEKKKHLYIKWLNKYGAFDYWLFKKTALDDTKSKHRGITTKNNIMQTVGIDTVTSQEVYYSYLSATHLEKLKYLARSIKVYAYLENNTFTEVIISNFTVDKNNEVRFTVTYPFNNTLI